MKKSFFQIILLFVAFAPFSSYADNFKVVAKGSLKYYNTELQMEVPLNAIEVQLWDSDVPDASTIIDDFMGTTFTDSNGNFEITGEGGDPFHYSYSRPDVYLRVVLRDPSGLVKISDELNHVQSYIIGIHEFDNVEGIVNFNSRVIDSGAQPNYGTKMMVFQASFSAWKEFVDNYGTPPSGFYDIEYWSAIYAGTPWTNRNTTHWPIGYPTNNNTSNYHEFGHAIRHSYDGSQSHWDWDNIRFIYARTHRCDESAWGSTEAVRKGFAFNEGWAEFWENQCWCTLASGDLNNMECEGNVAKALCDLSNNLPNKKWDMLKVLKNNPEKIHSYDDFFNYAVIEFPTLINVIRQPVTTNFQITSHALALEDQKMLLKKYITLQRAFTDSLYKLFRQSSDQAINPNSICSGEPCENVFNQIIRPDLLHAEIQISELITEQLIYRLENSESLQKKMEEGTFNTWYAEKKQEHQRKYLKLILDNLLQAHKQLKDQSSGSKELRAFEETLRGKIRILSELVKSDKMAPPANLNPKLAYDSEFRLGAK